MRSPSLVTIFWGFTMDSYDFNLMRAIGASPETRKGKRRFRKIRRIAEREGIELQEAASKLLKRKLVQPRLKRERGDQVVVGSYFVGEVLYTSGKKVGVKLVGYNPKAFNVDPPYRFSFWPKLGMVVKVKATSVGPCTEDFLVTRQQCAECGINYCINFYQDYRAEDSFWSNMWLKKAWYWALWARYPDTFDWNQFQLLELG